jgi:8-oxo-dGTP pyrophosphatase MutT (NUDIX family)
VEISAGGVVLKKERMVLLARRNEDWQFPKGQVEKGERMEETAVREVREETGVEARIVKSLGRINYWYYREGRRIYKTVHFFLMEAVRENRKQRDSEMDEVRWFNLEDAVKKISYRNERDILERANKEMERDIIWGNWSL